MILRELAGHPEWVDLIKKAEAAMPHLPVWNATQDNTEEWKRASAMREGFDLCLAFFRPIK